MDFREENLDTNRKKTWAQTSRGKPSAKEFEYRNSPATRGHRCGVKGESSTGPFALTSPNVFLAANLKAANFLLQNSHVRRCSVFVGSGVRTSQSQGAKPLGAGP